MSSISLCMIVKDEEEHLEKCLNSVKNLVDEIIIIDTGSIDKTKEIAKKFTNKLFEINWNNDFSEARNYSISKASKNWILILDADETISEKDKEKIKNLINKYEKAEAFILNCRTYTNDIGIAGLTSTKEDEYEESKIASAFYISKLLRLFRNKKEYYFEGRIHETPHNSIEKAGGKINDSDIVMHHFGALDKEKLINKKEAYIELLKERLEKRDFKEKPEDRICFEIGRELINLNRIKEATVFFEKALKHNEHFEYLLGLGGLYVIQDKLDEAEKILKKAIVINPKNSSVHDNLGVIYAKKGEYNKAIRKFEKTLELNQNSADAYFNLGLAYRDKGKPNKANKFFERAIDLNPSYKKKIDSLN